MCINVSSHARSAGHTHGCLPKKPCRKCATTPDLMRVATKRNEAILHSEKFAKYYLYSQSLCAIGSVFYWKVSVSVVSCLETYRKTHILLWKKKISLNPQSEMFFITATQQKIKRSTAVQYFGVDYFFIPFESPKNAQWTDLVLRNLVTEKYFRTVRNQKVEVQINKCKK